MLETLIARLGIQAGLKLSRGVVFALVIGGLIAAGGLGFWRGMVAIERMQVTAAATARDLAEANFKAMIEASNARVAEAQLRAATAAAEVSAKADVEISGLRAALSELETKNAALPNGNAGGLDRDRVRLLRRPGTTRNADPQRRNPEVGAGGGKGALQPAGRTPGSSPLGG